MKTPYLRQVEVILGPLPEHEGGGDEANAIRVLGDGRTDTLRVRFQINQPWVSSSIQIFNLGPKLRRALHAKGIQVILRAGWKNGTLTELFKGSLVSAFSTRQGADIITDLGLFCGWYATTQTVNKVSLTEGASVKELITSLAQSMPGVTVEQSAIDIVDRQFGKGGYADQGTLKQILDRLAITQGFNWGVRNGHFWAMKHDGFFQGNAIPLISGKIGYLIRAEPILVSPMSNRTGVNVSCLFDPNIKLMEKFRLESVLNPEIDGEYICHVLTHSGDTHSDQWQTDIQAWVPQEFQSTEPIVKKGQEWSDIEVIAGTIYGEASGESRNGKIAVGMTIRNRKNNPGKWGTGWKGVCQQKDQFVCWQDGNKSRIEAAHEQNNSTWKECMGVATDIYSGKVFDVGLSGQPTNFYSGIKKFSWANSMTYIGTIGGHKFYNDPKVGI